MPSVEYTIECNGETFKEKDILPKMLPIKQRILATLNSRIEQDWKLVKVEVTNLWTHEHSWDVIRTARETGHSEQVTCRDCLTTGWRNPETGIVRRDKKFEADKFEVCHEIPPRPKSGPKFI